MAERLKLTEKESKFIELYLKYLTGARAAREAGYSAKTARSIAYEMLRKPRIREPVGVGLIKQGIIPEWLTELLKPSQEHDKT